MPPRFICRVFESDEDSAVSLDVFVFAGVDYELAEFVWFDDPPQGGELNELLSDCLVALAAYDLDCEQNLRRRSE